MATIRLLASGGTIASTGTGGGHRATVSGTDLLATTTVPDRCVVDVVDIARVGSFAWQWADLRDLLRHIAQALDAAVDGVVVTHGTDTMEEVAFLAGLVHDDPRPVVFTGAQRPYDSLGPDGPANLGDALRVAASPVARDRGVLVAFDGEVYGAHGVTKVDTSGARAFAAPGRGPQLRVAGGGVHVIQAATAPPTLPLGIDDGAGGELARVDVVPVCVGTDASLLRAAVRAGARGLVLAAFGAGNANPVLVDAVGDAVREGIPVLVCSRVAAGPVYPAYRGGGGADLADAGAVFGADLSPWQGRMLLAAALSCTGTDPVAAVVHWLDTVHGRDRRISTLVDTE